MTQTLTVTLRDGITVLAKDTKYGPMAKTFANRTQAYNAAAAIDGAVVIQRGRPFFVRILTEAGR